MNLAPPVCLSTALRPSNPPAEFLTIVADRWRYRQFHRICRPTNVIDTCTGLALSTHVLSMYYLKVHTYWQGFGISNTQPWEVQLDINTL